MPDPKLKLDLDLSGYKEEPVSTKLDLDLSGYNEDESKKKRSIGTYPSSKLDSGTSIGSSDGKGFPKIDTNSIAPNFDEMKPAKPVKTVKNPKPRGFASEVFHKLATGSAQLGADIAAVPELVYETFSMPQNAIADYFDLPQLHTDSDKFKKTIGVKNAVKDYYKQEVAKLKEESEKVDEKYKYGVYDSFKNGNYKDGFSQLTNSFAESLPATASIMLGGAYAKTPQLLAASTMMFGAGKNEELKDSDPDMTTNARVINALGTGLAEGAFETIGSGSIGAAAKGIIEREGTKKAVTILKDGLVDFYKESLKKNPLITSIGGEGIEEWATQVTQNAIDVATGAKPQDYNVFTGGADAFIGGVFGGAVFGGGLKGLEKVANHQDKTTIKSNTKKVFELQKALENPDISETTQAEIHKSIDGLVKTNQELVQKNIDHAENLHPKVKEKLVESDAKIDDIKSKVKEIKLDNSITDSQKEILLEGLKNDFSAATRQKNDILEGKTTAVDVLPLKEQDKLKREALKELTTEQNPEGKKNITIDDKQITERANSIYEKQIKDESTKDTSIAETRTQTEVQEPQAEAKNTEQEGLNIPIEDVVTPIVNEPSNLPISEKSSEQEIFDFVNNNLENKKETSKNGNNFISGEKDGVKYDIHQNSEGNWRVTRIIDKEGKKVYDFADELIKQNEETPTTDIDVNGNVQPRVADVGESGVTEQENTPTESIPSAVDGGEGKSNVEVNDVDYAKDQIDKGVLNWNSDLGAERVNLGISWADIRKGQKDILAGKETSVPAKRLIEALKAAKEKGGYEYVQGRGGQMQKQFVSLEDVQRVSNVYDLTDSELEIINSNQEALAKEHEDYFNSLDEVSQQEILENYENRENNTGTIQRDSEGGKSENDVSDKKETRAGEESKQQEEVNKRPLIEKMADVPNSGEIGKYMSRENIEDSDSEEEFTTNQDYDKLKLVDSLIYGKSIVEQAKSVYGENYVEELIKIINNIENVDSKTLHIISLENDLRKRRKESTDIQEKEYLTEQINRLQPISQKLANTVSRALNLNKLRKLSESGVNPNDKSGSIYTKEELETKHKINQSFGKDIDDIQEQYEDTINNEIEDEENVLKYTQEDFDRELQKAKDELGKDYNITVFENLKRQAKKDKLSDKKEDVKAAKAKVLEDIRKVVRESMGQMSVNPLAKPIQFATLVTKLAKLHIQDGALSLEEVANNIYNDLKDISKDISKESIFNILKSKPKKVMSEATKRKIYINLLYKNIESLEAQIEAKKRNVVTKEDKYKNDEEIKSLREIRKTKQEELAKIDPSYAESRKLATDLKLAQESLDKYQRRIDEDDFLIKGKDSKTVNAKLKKLREVRDAKRKEFLSKKKKYDDSLKAPVVPPTEGEIFEKIIAQKIKQAEKALQDHRNKKPKFKVGANSAWNEKLSALKTDLRNLRNENSDAKKKANEIKNKAIELLINSGYGKEISVTKKEIDADGNVVKVKSVKNILDWKKLAGESGSIANISKEISKALEKQNLSEKEISEMVAEMKTAIEDLKTSITEKSLSDLQNKNKIHKSVNVNTEAKNLAQLYNQGIFDDNMDKYDIALNRVLGFDKYREKQYQDLKEYSRLLSNLFSNRNIFSENEFISEDAIKTQVAHINKEINKIVNKASMGKGITPRKVVSIIRDYSDMALLSKLLSLKQAIENPWSGFTERIYQQIGSSFDKIKLTPELKKHISKGAWSVFNDISLSGSPDLGDSSFSDIRSRKIDDAIRGVKTGNNKLSGLKNSIAGVISGTMYLNGADAFNKVKLVENLFAKAMIDILSNKNYGRKNTMTEKEATKFVSEALTGENFEKAISKAKEIIDNTNREAGKEILPNTDDNVYRLAMDVVKDNLSTNGVIDKETVKSVFLGSFKAAGSALGHEANNPLSELYKNTSQVIDRKIRESIKKKDYVSFTKYVTINIIKNLTAPFVSGRFNWVVLAAQKSGANLGLSILVTANKKNINKIDFRTEEGVKNLSEAVHRKLRHDLTVKRSVVGLSLNILAISALASTGGDDELEKILEKSPTLKKMFKWVGPPLLNLYFASQKGGKEDAINFILDFYSVTGNEDRGSIVRQFNVLLDDKSSKEKIDKAWGYVGKTAGKAFDTPIPWRLSKDVKNIKREITGEDQYMPNYNATSFLSGLFQGGFFESIGMRETLSFGHKEEKYIPKGTKKPWEPETPSAPEAPKAPSM